MSLSFFLFREGLALIKLMAAQFHIYFLKLCRKSFILKLSPTFVTFVMHSQTFRMPLSVLVS